MSPSRKSQNASLPFGVAHPMKVGRSTRIERSRRAPRHLPRDMLALKFAHIPNNVSFSAPGVFKYSANCFTVEIGTTDGKQTQVFSGPRWASFSESDGLEYVLIYADGVFWLERLTDFTNSLQHDVTKEGAPNPPSATDNPEEDPDSWLTPPADDNDSGSTIMLKQDILANESSNAALRTPPICVTSNEPQRSRYAGKEPTSPSMLRHNSEPSQPAWKSEANKTVSRKGAADVDTLSASPRASDGNNEEMEGDTFVIKNEEEEENATGEDRAFRPSSYESDSDDSSDDSGDDSSEFSADYTSRSSSDDN